MGLIIPVQCEGAKGNGLTSTTSTQSSTLFFENARKRAANLACRQSDPKASLTMRSAAFLKTEINHTIKSKIWGRVQTYLSWPASGPT